MDSVEKSGGRPKVVETAEFKDAVSKAVEEAMGKFAAQLGAARVQAGTQDSGESGDKDQDLIRNLALAIAELNDQGSKRKRVAPDVLAKWADAREKMGALIMAARAKGIKPTYRLIRETYLNERFLKPFQNDPDTKRPVPVEIGWSGVPNECMRPLDDAAKEIFAAFMDSIGGSTERTKGADNRPYWVTQGGLVVKGHAPAQRRTVSGLGDPVPDYTAPAPGAEPSPFEDDLVAGRANDPTAEFVNVLGTIAPPARQNYQGPR